MYNTELRCMMAAAIAGPMVMGRPGASAVEVSQRANAMVCAIIEQDAITTIAKIRAMQASDKVSIDTYGKDPIRTLDAIFHSVEISMSVRAQAAELATEIGYRRDNQPAPTTIPGSGSGEA